MRDFHLGVIGGCLTHQPGIALSDLYHRQLARRLAGAGLARLRLHVARNFKTEPLERLESLRRRHPLDGVLLHLRYSFVHKASLLPSHSSPSAIRYFLHPALIRRSRRDWATLESHGFAGARLVYHRPRHQAPTRQSPALPAAAEARATTPQATRIAGIPLRHLFYLGGAAVGLDHWAIREEIRLSQAVVAQCLKNHLPLAILGAGRRPDDFWLDRLCLRLDRRMQAFSRHHHIPYTSIAVTHDPSGQPISMPDGLHLNAAGHSLVARLLEPILTTWIRQLPRTSTPPPPPVAATSAP